MFFQTKDGTLRDPEIQSYRSAITRFIELSWDEKGVQIHNAKDTLVEGWLFGVVEFLSGKEWEELLKKVNHEEKKKASYVV